MRIVFIIILAFALVAGCLGQEKVGEKVEAGTPETQPEAPQPIIRVLGEYPLGDFGKLKNVTLLTKELKKGDAEYTFYQAIYTWEGKTYRSGALNRIYPDEETALPLTPPRAPGNAYNAAFQWIVNNTPKDAVILSWWDYGDLIRIFGQRETLVSDPCSRPECLRTLSEDEKDVFRYEDEEKFNDVVKFFTSNEDEAYKIAKKYGVDYVFVTYEDFPKSIAIDYLAGKKGVIRVFTVDLTGDEDKDLEKLANSFAEHRVSAYFARGDEDTFTVWYLIPEDVEKAKERMLLSLLPFKIYPGNFKVRDMLSNFELVYADNESYIYIFKVI